MTIAIAFNGGSYGTYLEWCLTTLTSAEEIVPPFSSLGNSHNYVGKHLSNIAGWRMHERSTAKAPFVRLHPKTIQGESLTANMNYLCESADSVVYLYPDRGSMLLSLNNFVYKTWTDWWHYCFTNTMIDVDKIYNNWPVSRDVDIADIPIWIKREFLSLYLMPAWFDQVEWYHPDTWQHPKCCIVTLGQLFYNFESTLQRVQKHCNLHFEKPISDLLPYHQINLTLQKYSTQDQICKQIIDAVINNHNLDWEEITLISESWVQWQLRNLGFELRCHELDKFPTNSVQLRELLYQI